MKNITLGSTLRIVVTGYVVRRCLGGLFWHYAQYLLGLRQLGHDVFFVEDSESLKGLPHTGLSYAANAFEAVGLGQSWAFFDRWTGTWMGNGAGRAPQFIADADVLLNVSASTSLRESLYHIPIRVLIDTDPTFTQAKNVAMPGWLDRILEHQWFFSFGENFHARKSNIVNDGIAWLPTRQPVVLNQWDVSHGRQRGTMTTVMSWRSYDPIKTDAGQLGVKEESFDSFINLPSSSVLPLEIALEAEPSIHCLLEAKGWKIVDAKSVSQDPRDYQRYIFESMGEFSLAKQAYVVGKTGWFSERSACYLASGRPVVTQNTDFTTWLDTTLGVLTFADVEGALTSLERLAADYERHSVAAREIAAEYFDAPKVLGNLLERVFSGEKAPEIKLPHKVQDSLNCFRAHAQFIDEVTPKNTRLIVLDDNAWWLHGSFCDRPCLPFLENRGQYWGYPRDDQHAITELERMRAEGWTVFVIVPQAQWWFSHWKKFGEHLKYNYHLLGEKNGLEAWDLSPQQQ